MGKLLFYYIGISWVTWYEASAHWIPLHSFPAQLKSCLLQWWPCLIGASIIRTSWISAYDTGLVAQRFLPALLSCLECRVGHNNLTDPVSGTSIALSTSVTWLPAASGTTESPSTACSQPCCVLLFLTQLLASPLLYVCYQALLSWLCYSGTKQPEQVWPYWLTLLPFVPVAW